MEAFVTPGFSGRSKSKIGHGGSRNKDLAHLNSAENDSGNSYFGRGELDFQTKNRRNGESDQTDQEKELKQYRSGFKVSFPIECWRNVLFHAVILPFLSI